MATRTLRNFVGSLMIGGGSALLFWNAYSQGVGFWGSLAATLVGDAAMWALGIWVDGRGDGNAICGSRNPVGTNGFDGHPGYVCSKRSRHRGPHAWVGHESTPNAVWGK